LAPSSTRRTANRIEREIKENVAMTHSSSFSLSLPSSFTACVCVTRVLASFCGTRTQTAARTNTVTLFPSFSLALSLSSALFFSIALCVYPAYCKLLFFCCHTLECGTGNVTCNTLLFAWDTGCFLRLISGTNIMIDGSRCYGKNVGQPEREKEIQIEKKRQSE